jgi:hypothetical protein
VSTEGAWAVVSVLFVLFLVAPCLTSYSVVSRRQQLDRRRERIAANLPAEANEPLVLPEGKGERAAPYVAKAIVRHTPTKSHPVHRLLPKAGQYYSCSTAHRNEEVAKRFREEAVKKERAPKARLQHAPLPKASSSKSSGSSAQVPAPLASKVPGIAPLASKCPPVKKEEVKQETKEEEFEEEPDWSPGEGVFEAAA